MKLRPSLLVLCALCCSAPALANPRPFGITYTAETTVEGDFELELYNDAVPTVAYSSQTGQVVPYLLLQFQTELEYGITDRLELGFYVAWAPTNGDAFSSAAFAPIGNGLKQRLRYSFAEPGSWPVDVALYGEVYETQRELELEAKVILQRRFGPVRAVLNLSAEREYYWAGQREWVLNPSAGVTVELTRWLHLGLEYWLNAELPDQASPGTAFNLGPHHYVGPTVLLNFGRLWWTTGVYARLNEWSYALAPGDLYGRFWVRSLLGLSF